MGAQSSGRQLPKTAATMQKCEDDSAKADQTRKDLELFEEEGFTCVHTSNCKVTN